MNVKLFEVRDSCTTMQFMAVEIAPFQIDIVSNENGERERKILRYAGYGPDRLIMWVDLSGGREAHYDPYSHRGPARTVATAHNYVAQNWDSLNSGDVIDVEFILGETTVKKTTDFL